MCLEGLCAFWGERNPCSTLLRPVRHRLHLVDDAGRSSRGTSSFAKLQITIIFLWSCFERLVVFFRLWHGTPIIKRHLDLNSYSSFGAHLLKNSRKIWTMKRFNWGPSNHFIFFWLYTWYFQYFFKAPLNDWDQKEGFPKRFSIYLKPLHILRIYFFYFLFWN